MELLDDSNFLQLELNGQRQDDLLYSGKSYKGPNKGVMLYFPPRTAVNKDDAKDGPIAILTTPLVVLTIYKETEGAAQ